MILTFFSVPKRAVSVKQNLVLICQDTKTVIQANVEIVIRLIAVVKTQVGITQTSNKKVRENNPHRKNSKNPKYNNLTIAKLEKTMQIGLKMQINNVRGLGRNHQSNNLKVKKVNAHGR